MRSMTLFSRPMFRTNIGIFVSLRTSIERNSIKFTGGNHYHEQMNWFCGEIEPGTTEQDTTENANLNRRQLLPRNEYGGIVWPVLKLSSFWVVDVTTSVLK